MVREMMFNHDSWIYKLPVQSVPITTKVVSLNPTHGDLYLIQHYVIVSVTYDRSSTNKADCHDITEILW
jgi:hypothetical protein